MWSPRTKSAVDLYFRLFLASCHVMKQSSEHDDHLVLLARIKFKYINITIKNGHVIEHCRNMTSLGYWAEQVDKVNRSQQSCQHTPKLDCGDDDDPAFRDRREQKKHNNSTPVQFSKNIIPIRQSTRHKTRIFILFGKGLSMQRENCKTIARQKIVLITEILFICKSNFQ